MVTTVKTMRSLWRRLPEAVRVALVMVAGVVLVPVGIGVLVWWFAWVIGFMAFLPWPELP